MAPRTRRTLWRIIDKGVNGKPFLWKYRGQSKYVMIDIFRAQADGCYRVLALARYAGSGDTVKGRLIGVGCADRKSDWVESYERARKIALRYMSEHPRRKSTKRR